MLCAGACAGGVKLDLRSATPGARAQVRISDTEMLTSGDPLVEKARVWRGRAAVNLPDARPLKFVADGGGEWLVTYVAEWPEAVAVINVTPATVFGVIRFNDGSMVQLR